MMSNGSPYPWFNPTKRYKFYAVILKSWSDTVGIGTETFLTAIQMAFTTNEWNFDKFLLTYKNYISISDYEIYRSVDEWTWEEFCEFMSDKYAKYIGRPDNHEYQRYYIDMTMLNTIEQMLPVTSEMYAKVEEDEYTCGVESLAIPLFVQVKTFLSYMIQHGYIHKSEELSLILRMVNKAVDVYVTLYLICINHDYSDHADMGEWFTALPDRVKIDLTMKADFPRPIEELEWTEIMTEDFNLMRWLVDIVGFPEVDDPGEPHNMLPAIVTPERQTEYANMVSSYAQGYGYCS